MQRSTGCTQSIWLATAAQTARPPLHEDASADVCIVGAGIAGLTTACLLAREGRNVVVLDHGPPAAGETGRTTAHLSSAIDDRFTELERALGHEASRLAAQSHAAAIDRIESLVSAERIDCAFTRLDGYLFLPEGEDIELLRKEFEAARRAGLSDVEWLDRIPVDDFDSGKCIRFPRQGQFHPLRYMSGLAAAVERDRGRIFSETHVDGVERDGVLRVKTSSGPTVTAGSVVVATNSPIIDRVAVHTKQAPYRTYVIGVNVAHGSVPLGLYWDTGDASGAYHYVRLYSACEPGSTDDVLIVGGEDHKTGQSDNATDRWKRLEAWTRERFPSAREVVFRWSGMVMETLDGLAYIGRNPGGPEGVYIATGDSGMGMTHGTIAGMLLCDLIQGRANPWEKLYDPARKTLKAAGEFARENLNVASQYTDWLKPGDVADASAIRPGDGAIIRRGLSLIAAYRDASGVLHEHSAKCTHLGCAVRWNSAEKIWDCPCHGSRFDAYGCVLNGPAASDLKAIEHPVKVGK
jgi:glycine/D-amino acid oxidase-like deaminating enzyme/nitrite reductase/ring-hydroxylating ferredoxin subunit